MSKLMQIIEAQTQLASKEFNLDSFMNSVVGRMEELTSATGAVVELIEGDEMVYKAASGSVAAYVGVRLKREGSLSGLCVSDGEMKISKDTSNDNRVDAAACQKVSAASMVCVPLYQRGEIVGVLKVVSNRVDAFSETDIHTLRLMAGVLGAGLGQQLEVERRRELEEQLKHLGQHDMLTKLPNRMLFLDRLEQAILRSVRNRSILALFYIDLDFFKPVNDTHGHQVGDALLCAFANRIRALFRSSDTFARLGGDEFTLIAENLSAESDAHLLADKIVKAAQAKFEIGDITLQIAASVGGVVGKCQSGNTDELIRLADSTLYDAKKAGRNCFRISQLIN